MGLHCLDSSSKEEKGAQEIEELYVPKMYLDEYWQSVGIQSFIWWKIIKKPSHEAIVQAGFFFHHH